MPPQLADCLNNLPVSFVAPLFSTTSNNQISHLLCFHNDANCPRGMGGRSHFPISIFEFPILKRVRAFPGLSQAVNCKLSAVGSLGLGFGEGEDLAEQGEDVGDAEGLLEEEGLATG